MKHALPSVKVHLLWFICVFRSIPNRLPIYKPYNINQQTEANNPKQEKFVFLGVSFNNLQLEASKQEQLQRRVVDYSQPSGSYSRTIEI